MTIRLRATRRLRRSDPVTYALPLPVLLVVALIASAAPAFRAAQVDPMESLRAD